MVLVLDGDLRGREAVLVGQRGAATRRQQLPHHVHVTEQRRRMQRALSVLQQESRRALIGSTSHSTSHTWNRRGG